MKRFQSPYSVWSRNSQFECSLHLENSCSVIWKSPVIATQRPIIPKTTKNAAQGSNQIPPYEELTPSHQDELSSSDQEPDPEITSQPHRQPQPVPSMFHALHRRPQDGLDCQ